MIIITIRLLRSLCAATFLLQTAGLQLPLLCSQWELNIEDKLHQIAVFCSGWLHKLFYFLIKLTTTL